MLTRDDEVDDVICEGHPEVCYCALNGKEPTQYSKTGAPIAALWDRIDILEKVNRQILNDICDAGKDLMSEATNDDLLDAFVLALTGTPLTREVTSLPEEWPDGDAGNPEGLSMEIVFAGHRSPDE